MVFLYESFTVVKPRARLWTSCEAGVEKEKVLEKGSKYVTMGMYLVTLNWLLKIS